MSNVIMVRTLNRYVATARWTLRKIARETRDLRAKQDASAALERMGVHDPMLAVEGGDTKQRLCEGRTRETVQDQRRQLPERMGT